MIEFLSYWLLLCGTYVLVEALWQALDRTVKGVTLMWRARLA